MENQSSSIDVNFLLFFIIFNCLRVWYLAGAEYNTFMMAYSGCAAQVQDDRIYWLLVLAYILVAHRVSVIKFRACCSYHGSTRNWSLLLVLYFNVFLTFIIVE